MSKPTGLTARQLGVALLQMPADALVEIASDPSLNNAGPVATTTEGAVHVYEARRCDTSELVIVLWPEEAMCWEDRYE